MTRNPKLKVVQTIYSVAGAKIFVQPIAEALSKNGFDVELWVQGAPQSNAVISGAHFITRDITTRLSANPFKLASSLRSLIAAFNEIQPDILHAHYSLGATLPLLGAAICRVPIRIYHCHGFSFLGHTGLTRLVLQLIERVNIALATQVLVVSQSNVSATKAAGLLQDCPVAVPAWGSIAGIDLAYFSPEMLSAEKGAIFKASHNISPNSFVVTYIGRPHARKGFGDMLSAWKYFIQRHPESTLIIAGCSPEECSRSLDPTASGVIALGFVDDLRPIYAACDVVALPSWHEGFGMALLEGAAAGKALVGSDIPGISCAIENGITGVLVPRHDPIALAESLSQLLANPKERTRLGTAARKRVQERFDREQVLSATVSIYNDILKRDAGAAKPFKNLIYRKVGKRSLDLVLATLSLLLAAPLLLLTALALLLANRGQVFFQQRRPGLQARPFDILKFKTMSDARSADGELLPDEQRLTKTGRIIRSWSLDELLQLINVLRGEMSLVGPRPLLLEYLPLYNAAQARRHEVRPGITGLAQVNGRNRNPWKVRLAQDVEYVDKLSLGLDLQILRQTVLVVFRRDGINSEHSATMERFSGN